MNIRLYPRTRRSTYPVGLNFILSEGRRNEREYFHRVVCGRNIFLFKIGFTFPA